MKYYPLRPIQRWLVDTHFNKAKSTMMNIGGLYRLSPLIDVDHLKEAINAVLETHDIFRCRFVFNPENCDLCQTFDNKVMPVVVEEWTDEEFQMITKYLVEPYDLIDKPLYRCYIFKTPSANYIFVDFYHAIMDGVAAFYLFMNALNMAYVGRIKSTPASYAKYIEEESKIPAEELAEGHEYWRKMLSTFDPKKHLPPVKVQSVKTWTKGNFKYRFKGLMEEFFRTTRVIENNYFLGACMLTLAKITGSRESIMSWIHNGRTNMRERRMMGLMLEQYPCAWDFKQDMSVGEFLNRLEGQLQIGMKYRKSLDIVYNEGLEEDCVSFIFQKFVTGDFIFAGTPTKLIYLPPNEISAAENALHIAITMDEMGTYSMSLDYDASRYSEKEMQDFSKIMNEILLNMRDVNKKISEII